MSKINQLSYNLINLINIFFNFFERRSVFGTPKMVFGTPKIKITIFCVFYVQLEIIFLVGQKHIFIPFLKKMSDFILVCFSAFLVCQKHTPLVKDKKVEGHLVGLFHINF